MAVPAVWPLWCHRHYYYRQWKRGNLIQLTAICSRPTLLSPSPISATIPPSSEQCAYSPSIYHQKTLQLDVLWPPGDYGGGAGRGVRQSVVSKASSSVVRSRLALEKCALVEREMEAEAVAMSTVRASEQVWSVSLSGQLPVDRMSGVGRT